MALSNFSKKQQSALPALFLAVGLSNFDRFAVGPMVLLLAGTFAMPVSEVSGIITAYFISYGLGQLVWGILSDRFGRIIIVRIALTGAAIGSIASALSPSLPFLLVTRFMTGAFCGALIPATITYIGDTISIENRQKSLANMLAVMEPQIKSILCL